MLVMKFGGTSVGTADKIKVVGELVKQQSEASGEKPIVIVSAVSGVTDLLIQAGQAALRGTVDTAAIEKKHNEIITACSLNTSIGQTEMAELKELLQGISTLKEISPKNFDYLVSFGERISSQLVAAYLTSVGMGAQHHFSFDIGMETTSRHMAAAPIPEAAAQLHKNLTSLDHIPVVTGYLGKSKEGAITTLGRGGSDYSAAIIGAAVGATEIQIWTDVDGIMTTDPRIVSNAQNIPLMSFQEASELSYFGAKVLHPSTIKPAMQKSIPVVVKNTGNAGHEGTRIVSSSEKSEKTVKAISVKQNITLVNIYSLRMLDAYGFLARIFGIFDKHHVVVDMVSTSEVSVSVTVNDKTNLEVVAQELSAFSQVKVENNKSIICVVGEGLKQDEKIVGNVFTTMSELGVNVEMISQGASDINLSFVIDSSRTDDVVNALHGTFF